MRQIRNIRRFVVVLGMLALLVSVATVAVATSIIVDGNGSDWAASDYQDSDAAEAEVPDQYDIVPVYATTDVGSGTYCVRYDTEGDLYLNGGSYTEIYLDLDGDSATGASQMCQSGFGNIGAERLVYWVMGSLDMCAIFEWNSGWQLVSMDCNGEPHGAGPNGGASVEICANAQDLGMAGDLLPTVKVFFENGDGSEPPPADDIFCFNYSPENGGGEGCTPGYWKQKQHFDSWVPPYSPLDPQTYFDDVFGVGPHETLLQVLKTGGGGEAALGRHAVAALLNAAGGGVSYEYAVSQIIAMVQQTYATGDFEGVKNLFEYENELGCPLD